MSVGCNEALFYRKDERGELIINVAYIDDLRGFGLEPKCLAKGRRTAQRRNKESSTPERQMITSGSNSSKMILMKLFFSKEYISELLLRNVDWKI